MPRESSSRTRGASAKDAAVRAAGERRVIDKGRAQARVAVILAAGAGRRMGGPKAALVWRRGQTFLAACAAAAERAGFSPVAVLGCGAPALRAQHPGLRSCVNRRWRLGQYASVRCGLRAALRAGAAEVAVHPVDMPHVSWRAYRALVAGRAGAEAVVASHRGRPGHPLLLTARAARKVLALRGVPHLEAALAQLGVRRVEVGEAGVLVDIDTPAGLSAVRRRQRASG